MIFEAIEPIRITTKTLGNVSLSPGDRLDWPDQAVQMLLAQYPGSVRTVSPGPPFHPGMSVTYQIPVNIQSPTQYSWQTHTGTIRAIDPIRQMILIVPESGADLPWVWIAGCYVKAAEVTA